MAGQMKKPSLLLFALVTIAIGQVASQGPRYYYTAESSTYDQARKTCQVLYGKNYGLAIIQNTKDMRALHSFVDQFISPGSEIWLGGVFSVDGSDKWVWDTLIDPKTKESTAFSDFALSLFQGGVPPQPSKKSVTSYTFIDKYTGQLDSTEPTSDLRFICEYRDENNNEAN